MSTEATAPCDVLAFDGDHAQRRADVIAHEEPLEIQVLGVSVAVVMRTPGHDLELALGFLATERAIEGAQDVVSLRHCSVAPTPDAEDNVVQVVLRDHATEKIERLRRNQYASSSCGVCGKATIDAALAPTLGPRRVAEAADLRVPSAVFYELTKRMRETQAAFESTGGVHAAALFDERGVLQILREDVGRHNAVDKVVGATMRLHAAEAPTLTRAILLVSGRVSFEIVQKAAAVGIPIVAGISAPTSLAVRFAQALGVTLVAFLRGETMNVYAHSERLSYSPGETERP